MKTSIMEGYTIILFCSSLLSILIMSTATDSINMSQSIREGGTIVSDAGTFVLGFFSPGDNSTKRYLGIWYKNISPMTVVWVANREIPLINSSGVLKVTNRGILVLLDHNEAIIWSSNSSVSVLNDPVALLLESGNLVVRDGSDQNPENFLWQSFDYPCDTLLPGMKLGRNRVTGQEWYLSSWKSTYDPSPSVTFWLDSRGFPELLVWNGSVEQFRSGPWNGDGFSGILVMRQNLIYRPHFNFSQTEIYYTYQPFYSSLYVRMVLNGDGIFQLLVWSDQSLSWNLELTTQIDNCDRYALCGAYGSCNILNSPVCGCLERFVPKYPKDWAALDWSNGCIRRTPSYCQRGDDFTKYSGVKLPETRNSWFNDSMTLEECNAKCLKNCSCTAYANLDVREGGSGCLLWFGDLIDIREFAENGQAIYIRMASSEPDEVGPAPQIHQYGSTGKKQRKIIVSLVLTGMLLLGLGLTLYIWKKKKKLSRQGKPIDHIMVK